MRDRRQETHKEEKEGQEKEKQEGRGGRDSLPAGIGTKPDGGRVNVRGRPPVDP